MKFKNVFVVDDDKIVHFIIKKLLSANNIDVNSSFFENGYEALKDLKNKLDTIEHLPDLILLDINMPIVDGWQFLEEFKLLKNSIAKKITIYIISSSDNAVDRIRAEEFNDEISDYFLKPVTVESIKSIFNIQ